MWFFFALLTTLAWGIADLFYKKGNDAAEPNSHLQTVIMVGFVMGAYGVGYMLISKASVTLMDMLRYLPVSAMYILSMALGYFGLRRVELSVSSPVQNSSGAVTAILCLIILRQVPTALEAVGIIIISAGLVFLALIERKNDLREAAASGLNLNGKKARRMALLFPLLYCAIDGLGTFADAFYLNEENPVMSEDTALLAYLFTFLIVGIACLLYLTLIKKQTFVIKKQGSRFLAAAFETAGQVFYVGVIGANAVVAAPMIASYCVVSVILSRIFLKEKLQKKQYAVVIAVVIGIILLGISEGLAE